MQSNEPYLIAMVAWATDFTYTHGVLCYSVSESKFRVLDIYGSATTELVLDASSYLPEEIPSFHWNEPYEFAPVHYCDGISSCELTQKHNDGTIHWLAILDPQKHQLIGLLKMEDYRNLFVRNNREYVVRGVYFPPANNRQMKWRVTVYNLQTQEQAPPVTLWDLNGPEIGSDVCFEIFEGYVYCVSNKARDARFPKLSFYYALRFPLNSPGKESFETPDIHTLWRRNLCGVGEDSRWNSLQLVRDEVSGKPTIYECRKEYLHTCGQGRRACYKKELCFDKFQTAPSSVSVTPDTPHVRHMGDNTGGVARGGGQGGLDIDSMPYTAQRLSDNVHMGDNGETECLLTINECFVRSYIPSCETFVDIVSSPLSFNAAAQQLRLRTRPKSFHEGISDSSPPHPGYSKSGKAMEGAEISQVTSLGARIDINYWPTGISTTACNPSCNILRDVLCVVSSVTAVKWAMDDRSLVFAVEGGKGTRSIVLISFDPGIQLPGFKNSASCDLYIHRKCSPDECNNEKVDASLLLHGGRDTQSQARRDPESIDGNDGGVLNEPINPTFEADGFWVQRCKAFYRQVPSTFAKHPHGADLAR